MKSNVNVKNKGKEEGVYLTKREVCALFDLQYMIDLSHLQCQLKDSLNEAIRMIKVEYPVTKQDEKDRKKAATILRRIKRDFGNPVYDTLKLNGIDKQVDSAFKKISKLDGLIHKQDGKKNN